MSISYAVFCLKKKTNLLNGEPLESYTTLTVIVTLTYVQSVFFFLPIRRPRRSTLFPYTTLFRSSARPAPPARRRRPTILVVDDSLTTRMMEKNLLEALGYGVRIAADRSEEHTSELQSHVNLVCRLLLEKKNKPAEWRTP